MCMNFIFMLFSLLLFESEEINFMFLFGVDVAFANNSSEIITGDNSARKLGSN